MLDFWAESVPGGSSQTVNVVVINDLEPAWKGEVRLNVMKGEDRLSSRCVPCEVAGFGRQVVSLPLDIPAREGDYTLAAELSTRGGTPVRRPARLQGACPAIQPLEGPRQARSRMVPIAPHSTLESQAWTCGRIRFISGRLSTPGTSIWGGTWESGREGRGSRCRPTRGRPRSDRAIRRSRSTRVPVRSVCSTDACSGKIAGTGALPWPSPL